MPAPEIDPDLPDELQQEEQELIDREDAQLHVFGVAMGKLRDEAVKARLESGIETVWNNCEEAYLCMDAANRHEFKGARWAKPTSMQGPVTTDAPNRDETRSTAFVRMTARYVDMGAAKVSEILLPIDDKAFSLSATPVPELINKQDDPTPAPLAAVPAAAAPGGMAMPAGPAGMPGAMPAAMPGMEAAPAAAPVPTVGDLARAAITKASEAAEKAETRIYDWMTEANFPGEMRKVIHDCARIGVGILKAPFPEVHTRYAYSTETGSATLVAKEKTAPGMRWIDPWNFFPHGGCGENIHHGEWVFERDFLSGRQLQTLKRQVDVSGKPIYLARQIDKVLEQGPDKCNTPEANRGPDQKKNKDRFTVWYFTGTIKRDDMAIAQAVGLEGVPKDMSEVYATVTMVNDVVIRATISPLDSGRFPYHAIPWSRRAGSWAGVGVGEQLDMPQRSVNAAVRSLFNNAGFSAGAQIILDPIGITPADQQWKITPMKIWHRTGEASTDDVQKLFQLVVFPNIGPQLLAIIQLAYKMAEEATNIPLISQGQAGPQTPDTFGATELQNNNANTLLRSIAYLFDDCITEPVVQQLYEWLLLDPDIPDEEKGDFQINARGSSAMVEKAIQEQFWGNLLQASMNPAFGLDPEGVMEQLLAAKRLDSRKVTLSDEKKQQRASQQPPPAPAVQAAQIREQGATERLQMELQATAQAAGQGAPDTSLQVAQIRSQAVLDTARLNQASDMAELNLKAEEAEKQRAFDREMSDRAIQLELMKLAQAKGISVDDAKVQLAKATMELNTQRELSIAALAAGHAKRPNPAPQVDTPPTEPAGRAEAGQAYAQ